jgi:hypothetical protein
MLVFFFSLSAYDPPHLESSVFRFGKFPAALRNMELLAPAQGWFSKGAYLCNRPYLCICLLSLGRIGRWSTQGAYLVFVRVCVYLSAEYRVYWCIDLILNSSWFVFFCQCSLLRRQKPTLNDHWSPCRVRLLCESCWHTRGRRTSGLRARTPHRAVCHCWRVAYSLRLRSLDSWAFLFLGGQTTPRSRSTPGRWLPPPRTARRTPPAPPAHSAPLSSLLLSLCPCSSRIGGVISSNLNSTKPHISDWSVRKRPLHYGVLARNFKKKLVDVSCTRLISDQPVYVFGSVRENRLEFHARTRELHRGSHACRDSLSTLVSIVRLESVPSFPREGLSSSRRETCAVVRSSRSAVRRLVVRDLMKETGGASRLCLHRRLSESTHTLPVVGVVGLATPVCPSVTLQLGSLHLRTR